MTKYLLSILVATSLLACNNSQNTETAQTEEPDQEQVQKAEEHSTSHLYIDVHHLGAGNVTAADVADAHLKDLAVQGKHDVKFLKYWVDESTGDVYCLSETTDPHHVTDAHTEAHCLIPDDVYRVQDGEEAITIGGKKFFLDIHELGPGNVTAEAVEEAHQKDLKTQGDHQVNFINYWVDEEKGLVFCLSEANSREDVIATHTEAHGLIPAKVLQVEQGE